MAAQFVIGDIAKFVRSGSEYEGTIVSIADGIVTIAVTEDNKQERHKVPLGELKPVGQDELPLARPIDEPDTSPTPVQEGSAPLGAVIGEEDDSELPTAHPIDQPRIVATPREKMRSKPQPKVSRNIIRVVAFVGSACLAGLCLLLVLAVISGDGKKMAPRTPDRTPEKTDSPAARTAEDDEDRNKYVGDLQDMGQEFYKNLRFADVSEGETVTDVILTEDFCPSGNKRYRKLLADTTVGLDAATVEQLRSLGTKKSNSVYETIVDTQYSVTPGEPKNVYRVGDSDMLPLVRVGARPNEKWQWKSYDVNGDPMHHHFHYQKAVRFRGHECVLIVYEFRVGGLLASRDETWYAKGVGMVKKDAYVLMATGLCHMSTHHLICEEGRTISDFTQAPQRQPVEGGQTDTPPKRVAKETPSVQPGTPTSPSKPPRRTMADLMEKPDPAKAVPTREHPVPDAETQNGATATVREIHEDLLVIARPKRNPVPDAETQQQALATVREIYKDQYDAATTLADKEALAQTLLQTARQTDGAAERYALLRVARDTAIQAGSPTAFRAVDEMGEVFEIDALDMKIKVLAKYGSVTKTSAQHKAITGKAVEFCNEAFAGDRFALAGQAAGIGVSAATKAGDTKLAEQIAALRSQADDAEMMVKPALAVLKVNPDNPEASLTAGKYYLTRGRWTQAFSMLAKCSDPTLKQLATEEIQGSPNAKAQVALGDGWWDSAQEANEPEKGAYLARAAHWYRKAQPGIQGLDAAKVQKRLTHIVEIPGKLVRSSLARDAVESGLNWLVRHQRADGSWGFDTGPNPGDLTDCRNAATGMGLLPFLHAGYTHRHGPYQPTVSKGLVFLAKQMKISANGAALWEQKSTMYSHGICARAFCEAYAQTRDKQLLAPAQGAVNFIVYSQDPVGGGWRYAPRQPGDTSVFGWQMGALDASAGRLRIPKKTAKLAWGFLDSVQSDDGSSYGYAKPGNGVSTTPIGLLGRLQLSADRSRPEIRRGVKRIADTGPSNDNAYFNYYATQLMHRYGGEQWEVWRTAMQDRLVRSQEIAAGTAGSWYKGYGAPKFVGEKGGRLAITSLCLMTLIETVVPKRPRPDVPEPPTEATKREAQQSVPAPQQPKDHRTRPRTGDSLLDNLSKEHGF